MGSCNSVDETSVKRKCSNVENDKPFSHERFKQWVGDLSYSEESGKNKQNENNKNKSVQNPRTATPSLTPYPRTINDVVKTLSGESRITSRPIICTQRDGIKYLQRTSGNSNVSHQTSSSTEYYYSDSSDSIRSGSSY